MFTPWGNFGFNPAVMSAIEGDILMAAMREAIARHEARMTEAFSTPLYFPHNTRAVASKIEVIIQKVI